MHKKCTRYKTKYKIRACFIFAPLLIASMFMACESLPRLGAELLYVRVYNDDGNPVQFATVTTKPTITSHITDGYGRVAIVLHGPDSPIEITVQHPLYLPRTVMNDGEILFVVLRSRANFIRDNYSMAKSGHVENALHTLISEPAFSPESPEEQYYLALLYYLNNNFDLSIKTLDSISEGSEGSEEIDTKEKLLTLIDRAKRKNGGRP